MTQFELNPLGQLNPLAQLPQLKQASPALIRHFARQQQLTGPTAGLAKGFVQVNLAIMPKTYAADFLQFCLLNPKACPLVAMSQQPGEPQLALAGQLMDIRTDAPAYRRFVKGETPQTILDLTPYWRDDLCSFLIGCSFSFEEALVEAGIELRHHSQQCNVPMYNSNIRCSPAGPFHGNMVVSMRPMLAADAIRAVQICSRFPNVHGAPVHLGDPKLIGIDDLTKPDYGDAVIIKPGELPVFWACGVTPQVAIKNAGLELAFSHEPGCMLVTDLRNSALAAF